MSGDKAEVRREILDWRCGLKIVHLSDLHLKGPKRIDWLQERLHEEMPDLVVMTGDFADTRPGMLAFAGLLGSTATRWPTFWVAGNHDSWYGPGFVDEIKSVVGAHCIDDEPALLRAGHLPIRILSPKAAAAAGPRRIDEKRVVLLHNPRKIQGEWLANCDLVLAGHLHGGQFIFWTSKSGMHYPGALALKWCCDRRQADGATVIVNRGFGDFLPLRFRCAREIVVIEV